MPLGVWILNEIAILVTGVELLSDLTLSSSNVGPYKGIG